MKKETLAVVVLTRNEEHNLKRCFESVKWADEIIVVDDNSTDSTKSVAADYSAKIITRSMEGDFAAQRNAGSEAAVSDWILQIDADEVVTNMLKNEIANVLDSGSDFNAFRFGRINNFCGRFLKHGGEESHRPLRLFRKGKAIFKGDKIHETLKVQGEIGELRGHIEHYNFPDITHYIQTQDKYSTLEAKAILEKEGIIPGKKLKKRMTSGVIKLFCKIYFKKKGYKDGFYGLIFAVLSAWRRFMIHAKYWELINDQIDDNKKVL